VSSPEIEDQNPIEVDNWAKHKKTFYSECFILFYIQAAVPSEGFSKNRIKTIEHISLKFYLTNNRVWWRLVPTNGSNN
jgi:hypothetical protein